MNMNRGTSIDDIHFISLARARKGHNRMARIKLMCVHLNLSTIIKSISFWLKLNVHSNLPNLRHASSTSDPLIMFS